MPLQLSDEEDKAVDEKVKWLTYQKETGVFHDFTYRVARRDGKNRPIMDIKIINNHEVDFITLRFTTPEETPAKPTVVESGVTCPARVEQYGPWEKKEGLDSWEQRGPDRCCSFCGSFHPEDFLALVKQGADPDSTVRIDGASSKPKWWVHRPEVPTAKEGGLKFYGYHARGWDKKINEYLPEALRVSREKFKKDFERRKAERYPNP